MVKRRDLEFYLTGGQQDERRAHQSISVEPLTSVSFPCLEQKERRVDDFKMYRGISLKRLGELWTSNLLMEFMSSCLSSGPSSSGTERENGWWNKDGVGNFTKQAGMRTSVTRVYRKFRRVQRTPLGRVLLEWKEKSWWHYEWAGNLFRQQGEVRKSGLPIEFLCWRFSSGSSFSETEREKGWWYDIGAGNFFQRAGAGTNVRLTNGINDLTFLLRVASP